MPVLNLSEVEIGQMALSHIGDNTNVESFDQKGSAPSQLKIWYNFARVKTLEAYNWSFARRRQTLALHGDDPPSEFAFRYQYPATCVKLRYLVNPAGRKADPIPFEVEISEDGTRSIVTSLGDACAVFTADVNEPALWSIHFIDALSYQLAFNIAWALTKKIGVQQAMRREFNKMISLAPARDANEEQQEPPRDTDWIRGRE